ncbi:hypothetical protein GYMLUDRAFT_534212 [Collybiopsis luxurians FD-317 M1]|nr:hypothetical protein GYMLUDRAFT_534212 [Collybiopsis luxurians FD-317 M1]
MGCTLTFYCGHTCQKSHWISEHRTECCNHARSNLDRADGLPRQIEKRDFELARSILRSEFWSIRSNLQRLPLKHRLSMLNRTIPGEVSSSIISIIVTLYKSL